MRRRRLLSVVGAGTGLLTGCLTVPGGETATASPTPSPPSGTVDNHRTTDVVVDAHDAHYRDGSWVVTVRLDLQPVGGATPYPIGLFVYFFDADGDELREAYEQVPANTSGTARTATRSAALDTAVDALARYRIDVVHA